MPVGPGHYAVTKSGVRLHFTPGGTVNEAKNMKTGKVHTAAEFRADRAKRQKHGMGYRAMGGE